MKKIYIKINIWINSFPDDVLKELDFTKYYK